MKELRSFLNALAAVSRLRIVHYLARCVEETTVTDLAKSLKISQPLLSWHLRTLRRAKLVNTRRVGRVVYCSLDYSRLAWCQMEISKLWSIAAEEHVGEGDRVVGPRHHKL